MDEPSSSLELLLEEEGGANLIYSAFAAPTVSAPDLSTVLLGPLPDVLSGRYRLGRIPGAGDMGMIYRARDLLYEQFGDPASLIALKLLNESVTGSSNASALFYSELALTRRLCHPSVVRLFTSGADTACQHAYIVMEFMSGLPLDRLFCGRPEDLPWSELSTTARPLLNALAYVHEQGVLHGDLKPSNVMLGEEGVRLFDFGLDQAQAGILDDLPQLSRGRTDAWTPSYAASELLEGTPLSPAAGLYALTCVLYELIDGHHPFRRPSSNQAREQGLGRRLRALGRLPRRCWPALYIVLSFDPGRRCIGVRELQEALGARRSWLADILAR